jgi:hypothetical protein
MRLFLIELVVFVLPIFFIGIVLEFMIRNVPTDLKLKVNYLDRNAKSIKVLVLGNSHSYYGINPKYFDKKGYNCAYVSQSLKLDKLIFGEYIGLFDSLEYIVWGISSFSPYYELEKSPERWRTKDYVLNYHIKTHNLKDRFFLLNSRLPIIFRKILRYKIFGAYECSMEELGNGIRVNTTNLDCSNSGKIAAQRHNTNDESNRISNYRNITDVIKLADSLKIQVLLITLPTLKKYQQYLDRNFIMKTDSFCTKMGENYTNVLYLNYSNDTTFAESYFSDADHLNEDGAKKMSIKINQLIK